MKNRTDEIRNERFYNRKATLKSVIADIIGFGCMVALAMSVLFL